MFFLRLTKLFPLFAVASISLSCAAPARADEFDNALQRIADFADQMCQEIPIEAHDNKIALTGAAEAQLSDLLQYLADLGVEGSISYNIDEYKGLMREDLIQALEINRNCKLTIWADLKQYLRPFDKGAVDVPVAISDDSPIKKISKWVYAEGGGAWGSWREDGRCPDGTFAWSVRIKVEPKRGNGDDTGLNAVRFQCRAPNSQESTEISSGEGRWGDWSDWANCPSGAFFTSYNLRVEASVGSGDDTAANDIKLTCRKYDDYSKIEELVSPIRVSSWGNWGDWRETGICPDGTFIVGFRSRVEAPVDGDDTSFNDMKVLCQNY